MVTLALRIEPELCGPISIGTASVIKLVARHLELDLAAAMSLVSRAVYEGETVMLEAPCSGAASAFMRAVSALPKVPRVHVEIVEK